MLRMDQVHVVRHKVLVEGRSQRAVARELGLARVTVRKYLDQAVPLRKVEAAPQPRPVWDAVAERHPPASALVHHVEPPGVIASGTCTTAFLLADRGVSQSGVL